MPRISDKSIECAIELYVNCIYDDKEESGWSTATFDEWKEAVWTELANYRTTFYGSWTTSRPSAGKRFDGKAKTMKRIEPILKQRLERLIKEGYEITAVKA